jgi:hypothetical protein
MQMNFSQEIQTVKKELADVHATDYAVKCRELEAKLQQTTEGHQAEVHSLQEQLDRLLECANTQKSSLPEVAGERRRWRSV